MLPLERRSRLRFQFFNFGEDFDFSIFGEQTLFKTRFKATFDKNQFRQNFPQDRHFYFITLSLKLFHQCINFFFYN